MRVAHVSCVNLPEPDFDESLTVEAFRNRGHEIEVVAWDGEVEWQAFDVAIIRSTWNYPEVPTEFAGWVQFVSQQTRLLNPADVVLWNLDKHYLAELDVPVVPTTFGTSGEIELPAEGKFVVKPTIGAGSMDTRVFESGEISQAKDWLDEFPKSKGFMVQPFLESVLTVGEQSIVCIGKTPMHRIEKRPRFVGQDESVTGPFPVEDEFVLIAEKALERFATLLYARVDLIQCEGTWLLSELELIEPSLFLLQNPEALGPFVEETERLVSRLT
ncbi:MAG TPA: hypothetical protein PKA27_15405 [Fimbriimonadaceae bacterium]|nr:hypothetical protein [Fimbriimonadaceae bacterium]